MVAGLHALDLAHDLRYRSLYVKIPELLPADILAVTSGEPVEIPIFKMMRDAEDVFRYASLVFAYYHQFVSRRQS